jgi:hypothetical protein
VYIADSLGVSVILERALIQGERTPRAITLNSTLVFEEDPPRAVGSPVVVSVRAGRMDTFDLAVRDGPTIGLANTSTPILLSPGDYTLTSNGPDSFSCAFTVRASETVSPVLTGANVFRVELTATQGGSVIALHTDRGGVPYAISLRAIDGVRTYGIEPSTRAVNPALQSYDATGLAARNGTIAGVVGSEIWIRTVGQSDPPRLFLAQGAVRNLWLAPHPVAHVCGEETCWIARYDPYEVLLGGVPDTTVLFASQGARLYVSYDSVLRTYAGGEWSEVRGVSDALAIGCTPSLCIAQTLYGVHLVLGDRVFQSVRTTDSAHEWPQFTTDASVSVGTGGFVFWASSRLYWVSVQDRLRVRAQIARDAIELGLFELVPPTEVPAGRVAVDPSRPTSVYYATQEGSLVRVQFEESIRIPALAVENPNGCAAIRIDFPGSCYEEPFLEVSNTPAILDAYGRTRVAGNRTVLVRLPSQAETQVFRVYLGRGNSSCAGGSVVLPALAPARGQYNLTAICGAVRGPRVTSLLDPACPTAGLTPASDCTTCANPPTCACPPTNFSHPITGECTLNATACANERCGRRGSCDVAHGTCACGPSFFGDRCDQTAPVCAALRCGDRGICTGRAGCSCRSPWTGASCAECMNPSLLFPACQVCVNPEHRAPACTSCMVGVHAFPACSSCSNSALFPNCTTCPSSRFGDGTGCPFVSQAACDTEFCEARGTCERAEGVRTRCSCASFVYKTTEEGKCAYSSTALLAVWLVVAFLVLCLCCCAWAIKVFVT